LPIAFSVTAPAGAGLNCAWSRPIDGSAISTRIATGSSVQITSIVVLWLVLEGIGFACAR